MMKRTISGIFAASLAALALTTSNASAQPKCVALTIVRPAVDAVTLLETPQARTVLRGEGLSAATVTLCNPDAKFVRVKDDNMDVVTFAAYIPGKGATLYVPKTRKHALAYFSKCESGKRIYRSATVMLDKDQTAALQPKEVSNAGCGNAS